VTPAKGADFGPPQRIGGVGDLTDPAAAVPIDVDRDGDLDVAAFGSDRLAWYPNLGHGTFGKMKTITKDVHTYPQGRVVASDVNLDGRTDLVVAYYEYPAEAGDAKSKLAWYQYKPASGTWQEHVISVGSVAGLIPVAVTDLDRDGDRDVVAANYRFEDTRKVVWFENAHGGVTWRLHVISDDESIGTGSRAVAVADADADGWPDVFVAARFSGTVVMYRNPNSPQQFAGNWAATVLDDRMDEATDIAAADLDGDVAVDVVATTDNPYDEGSSSRARVTWYRNDPQNPGHYGAPVILAPVGGLYRPWSVQPIDLDLDGDKDLLVGGVDNVTWIENQGGGQFSAPQGVGTANYVRSIAADLDGDGRPDVLSPVAPAKKIVWYRNVGGASVSGTVFKDSNGNRVRDPGEAALKNWLVWADLNGDGRLNYNEPRAASDGGGQYVLTGVPAGRQFIRLEKRGRWQQTYPRGGGAHILPILANTKTTGWHFGVRPASG
jgi:hypothetical protein